VRRQLYQPTYRSLLEELRFRTELPIVRRFQCHRCLIPIGEVVVAGKLVRINVDGSKHWKSCKSR